MLAEQSHASGHVLKGLCACGQATSAKLMWNAGGSAVLALTASEVDATNQSYYGEQKLSFLAADGRNDCLVPLKVPPHPLSLCTAATTIPIQLPSRSLVCVSLHDSVSGWLRDSNPAERYEQGKLSELEQ